MNPRNELLFSSELWGTALEKFGRAAQLTVRLFDADERAVLGPVHPTPLFQLFDESGYDPGIFAECARRCIAQTDTRPAVIVSQFHGLAAVGTSLMLEGRIVGAAVGGYAFAEFSQVPEIQRLARQGGIAFERLWHIARKQSPMSEGRLLVHAELLQVLGDALLRENLRTRQYRQTAAIVESSDDAIISKDLDSIITSWNRGAERVFGYTAQEAIGQPATMLMPPDRADEEPGILERIRHGESVEHYETVRRRKDGALLDISLTVSPIADASGKIIGASKIEHDITGRKQAEERLRQSEERLRFMAESMPQKIFTAKPDGGVDYFNAQWMEFTGLTSEQIRDWGWTQFIHPDDVEENVRRWKHSIETGEYFEFEHRFRRKDGEYRWHLSRAHAMRDGERKIVMWIGSSTDIDEQKRAGEKLEKTVAERTVALRETVGELEAFSYSVSHDMRAPLRAMRGFADVLVEENASRLDARGVDFLNRISTAASRMDRLIEDVLSYSRVLRADVKLEPIDLGPLLREVIGSYPQLHAAEVEIRVAEGMPRVAGNEASLTQCISNLLSNAVKFVAPGMPPRVKVWTEERGTEVRLWIEDNGVGLEPRDQVRIFRIFERVRITYEGTGIGLAIVRKAIERMNGRVGVESTPGHGSKFWIELRKAPAS